MLATHSTELDIDTIADKILSDEDTFMQYVVVAAGNAIEIMALPTPSEHLN